MKCYIEFRKRHFKSCSELTCTKVTIWIQSSDSPFVVITMSWCQECFPVNLQDKSNFRISDYRIKQFITKCTALINPANVEKNKILLPPQKRTISAYR